MPAASQKPAAYPVTIKQRYMLDQAAHPDCPEDLRNRWLLAYGVLVKPSIDQRRFRRAVDKLVQRHDTLRIGFDRQKTKWRAIIRPVGTDILRHIDLGDMDDTTFQSEITAIANTPLPILGDSLVEMVVVKCGARGDVLIVRIHHAITDGYGLVLLIEDLIKLLIGIPIIAKPLSFGDYVLRHQNPPASRAKEIAAFWEKMHADFPKNPMVGRKAKGLEPLTRSFGPTDQRHMYFHATPESVAAFEAKAEASDTSATTRLMAGHLEAICQSYDLEKLMFMAPTGRSDPLLAQYAGDHTHDILLPYATQGDTGFSAATKQLSDGFVQAVAHLPTGTGWRGEPYENGLIDAGCYPGQFSLYLPRHIVREKKSVFKNSFRVQPGDEQVWGPLRIIVLDVSQPTRLTVEMELNLGAEEVRTGFGINYDGIAYTDNEIRALGEKNFALNGLVLAKVSVT